MDNGKVLGISGSILAQWRQQARQDALNSDIPLEEVDWFLQALTNLDSLSLRLESFQRQSTITLTIPWSKITQLWQQRIQQRIPAQYLVGVAPWRNFVLKVSPAVLIPRPETEYLIDLAIQAIQQCPYNIDNWVDLGTGSGAIALGLAEVFPSAQVHGVDSSSEALKIAQENAQNTGLTSRVKFYQGDWWEPLIHLKGQLGGMVSNPPYIPTTMLSSLQPEVTNHEPHLALDGGDDGLDCLRYLVQTAPEYLKSGGLWLVEMMAGQGDAVSTLLHTQGSYENIQIFPDLAGIDRFVMAFLV